MKIYNKKVLPLILSVLLIGVNVSNSEALTMVEKIQGKDSYEVAAKVASKQNYTTAIIVNADKSVADGLSASGLSGTVDAPILLTSKDTLPSVTLDKLNGVKKVYIIGGTEAISINVENEIKYKGIEVKRIGGSDRLETSYNVAKEIASIKPVTKIMLTNAYKGEADAMSIAPVAVRYGAPIILTNGNTIPFDAKNIESYVIGGNAIMTDELVENTNSIRLGGLDRFGTNKIIINKFYPGIKEFHITKGWTLTDALVTAPIAKNAPTLFAEIGSDKTMLQGATKLTFVGSIDKSIIKECLDESNKDEVNNEYTKAIFNIEMSLVSNYTNSINELMKYGWSYVVKHAEQEESRLVDTYNLHLSINGNSELYNAMTEVLYNNCMVNKSLVNNDINEFRTWSNKLSNSLDKVSSITSMSKMKKIN